MIPSDCSFQPFSSHLSSQLLEIYKKAAQKVEIQTHWAKGGEGVIDFIREGQLLLALKKTYSPPPYLSSPDFSCLSQHAHIIPIYHIKQTTDMSIMIMPFRAWDLEGLLNALYNQTKAKDTLPPYLKKLSPTQSYPIHLSDVKQIASERETILKEAQQNPLWLFQRYSELVEAVHYLHQKGYVHLDIKPGNVLLSSSSAFLTDFGLTKTVGTPLLIQGSKLYASPQLLSLSKTEFSLDLYALGMILLKIISTLLHQPFLPYQGITDNELAKISNYRLSEFLAYIQNKPISFWQRGAVAEFFSKTLPAAKQTSQKAEEQLLHIAQSCLQTNYNSQKLQNDLELFLNLLKNPTSPLTLEDPRPLPASIFPQLPTFIFLATALTIPKLSNLFLHSKLIQKTLQKPPKNLTAQSLLVKLKKEIKKSQIYWKKGHLIPTHIPPILLQDFHNLPNPSLLFSSLLRKPPLPLNTKQLQANYTIWLLELYRQVSAQSLSEKKINLQQIAKSVPKLLERAQNKHCALILAKFLFFPLPNRYSAFELIQKCSKALCKKCKSFFMQYWLPLLERKLAILTLSTKGILPKLKQLKNNSPTDLITISYNRYALYASLHLLQRNPKAKQNIQKLLPLLLQFDDALFQAPKSEKKSIAKKILSNFWKEIPDSTKNTLQIILKNRIWDNPQLAHFLNQS